MRLLLVFAFLACSVRAALPPELEAALKDFRGDPPPGWSYTQTTSAEGKSTVERCNAARPEFDRWTLVQKDGRAPTADDLKAYGEARSRRSRNGTAPRLIDQFDLSSIETVSTTEEKAIYRFRLRPGESRDHTAIYLRATVALNRPARTIESIELGNTDQFSPTLGVKITELKTLMTYTLPHGATPSLPRGVQTRVRGRAFLFKSLDSEMSVTYSDYAQVVKK